MLSLIVLIWGVLYLLLGVYFGVATVVSALDYYAISLSGIVLIFLSMIVAWPWLLSP